MQGGREGNQKYTRDKTAIKSKEPVNEINFSSSGKKQLSS